MTTAFQTDQAIIVALRSSREAEARYAACAARCDVVGREKTPEDEAELEAASTTGDDAKKILLTALPQTPAGMFAVLEYMEVAMLRYDDTQALAANLLASPAWRLIH